ncbi:MAG TPA: hypothetical protein VNZ52_08125 [Candidatus Thermoplasmatota archaeon]|nr:hypothetical protein [Candidatus Thermoplasmatota archaeon]
MDPFEPITETVNDTVATLKGDFDAEFLMTTYACGEEGNWCGGGPVEW